MNTHQYPAQSQAYCDPQGDRFPLITRFQHLANHHLPKALLSASLLLLIPLSGCQIEREQAGRLPEVDVDPGRLPEYDINGPDVNVGVTERTVTVPKLIVIQEEETVQVPYIDVDVPGAERQERTITAEVEVPSNGYDLNIQEIYSVDGELWVISRLVEENPNAPETSMRVSDRIVFNAPDMPVRHYVIGDRPAGTYNEQYTFIDNLEEINSQLAAGRQLYTQQAFLPGTLKLS